MAVADRDMQAESVTRNPVCHKNHMDVFTHIYIVNDNGRGYNVIRLHPEVPDVYTVREEQTIYYERKDESNGSGACRGDSFHDCARI